MYGADFSNLMKIPYTDYLPEKSIALTKNHLLTLPKISLSILQPFEQRETSINWNGHNIANIACIHFQFGTMNTRYMLKFKTDESMKNIGMKYVM